MQQKNSNQSKKKLSKHNRSTKSLTDITRYGPPPIPQTTIKSSMGYQLSKNPQGLKKVKRVVTFDKAQRGQSCAYMAMKVGQTNMLKRFRKIKYLQPWKSKKNMFNLCQENLIAKMHQKLLHFNVKSRSLTVDHRKYSSQLIL